MNLFERFSWMQRHGRREHRPEADILRIELDGWELILRKIGPCEHKVELVALKAGLVIYIAALDTPAGGTPTLLASGNIQNLKAIDDTGASVPATSGTTGADTQVASASGAMVDVPAGTTAIELGATGAGAKTVTVTADVTDSDGNVRTGIELVVTLPVADTEGVELVAFNAP